MEKIKLSDYILSLSKWILWQVSSIIPACNINATDQKETL